jgi:predicted transposase YbfD/YdcC
LENIFVIALVGIICGCEGWDEIEDYAQSKREWLGTFLDLPNDIPSEATLRRVFSLLKPEDVERVYREWIRPYIGSCINKQISIDGKTVCGVSRGSGEISNLHVVSAWVKEDGVCFGQLRTDEKSNEITAIPLLIDSLDVRGGIVTIDAMGCQKAIAAKIIQKEANYVLAVKANQPTLMSEMKEYFAWAREDTVESRQLAVYQEDERTRERRVIRQTTVSNEISWFESRPDWEGLRTFVQVEQQTITPNGTTKEERLYISSLQADAVDFSRLTRGHWSIENSLHWVLDTSFHEDASLVHTGHAPENFSVMRKLALTMLKKAGSPKVSIRRKQKIASYSDDFLAQVLAIT